MCNIQLSQIWGILRLCVSVSWGDIMSRAKYMCVFRSKAAVNSHSAEAERSCLVPAGQRPQRVRKAGVTGSPSMGHGAQRCSVNKPVMGKAMPLR